MYSSRRARGRCRLASKGVISARRHYSFPSRATQFFWIASRSRRKSAGTFHRPAALITRHRGILSWKRETSAPRKFPHVSSPVSPVSSLPRLSINLFDSFSQFSFHSSPIPRHLFSQRYSALYDVVASRARNPFSPPRPSDLLLRVALCNRIGDRYRSRSGVDRSIPFDDCWRHVARSVMRFEGIIIR